MITLQQFINKYKGDALYNDYGAQCVLLAKKFSEQVLGIKLGYFGGSAKNGFINDHGTFHSDKWIKHINTPQGIPAPGSLIFFKGGIYEPYGHVGVVVEADVNNVTILEQNGGMGKGNGKGSDAIRVEAYNYKHVSGRITAKTKVEPDFHKTIEDYSNGHIVVLYNSKYYINLKNKRIEVNHLNFKEILG